VEIPVASVALVFIPVGEGVLMILVVVEVHLHLRYPEVSIAFVTVSMAYSQQSPVKKALSDVIEYADVLRLALRDFECQQFFKCRVLGGLVLLGLLGKGNLLTSNLGFW